MTGTVPHSGGGGGGGGVGQGWKKSTGPLVPENILAPRKKNGRIQNLYRKVYRKLQTERINKIRKKDMKKMKLAIQSAMINQSCQKCSS